MPRINKNSISDTENDMYYKATIMDMNRMEETVTISTITSDEETTIYDVPAFYHCIADPEEDGLGGLRRGIEGFNVGDQVVVSKDPLALIYSETLKPCNISPVVIFDVITSEGTIVLVYDITNNLFVDYELSSGGALGIKEAFNLDTLTADEAEFFDYFIMRQGGRDYCFPPDKYSGSHSELYPEPDRHPFDVLTSYCNKLANGCSIDVLGSGQCKEYGSKSFCEGPGFWVRNTDNITTKASEYWKACGNCEQVKSCDGCDGCDNCDKCIDPCIKKYNPSNPDDLPAEGCAKDGDCFDNILLSPFLCTYPNDFTYNYPEIVNRTYDMANLDYDTGWYFTIPFPTPSKVDSYSLEYDMFTEYPYYKYKGGYHETNQFDVTQKYRGEYNYTMVNLYGLELDRATLTYSQNLGNYPHYVACYCNPAGGRPEDPQEGSLAGWEEYVYDYIDEIEDLGLEFGESPDPVRDPDFQWIPAIRLDDPYKEDDQLSLPQFTETSQKLTIDCDKEIEELGVRIKIEKTESIKLFSLVTPLGFFPETTIEDIKEFKATSANNKTYVDTDLPMFYDEYDAYTRVCKNTEVCGVCEGEPGSPECEAIEHCYEQQMVGRGRYEGNMVKEIINFFDRRDDNGDATIKYDIDQSEESVYKQMFIYGWDPHQDINEDEYWKSRYKTELTLVQKAFDFGDLTFRMHFRVFYYAIYDWPTEVYMQMQPKTKKPFVEVEYNYLRTSLLNLSILNLANYLQTTGYYLFIKTECTEENKTLIVEEIMNQIYDCHEYNETPFKNVLLTQSVSQIKQYITNYKLQEKLELSNADMLHLEEDDIPDIVDDIISLRCAEDLICPTEEIHELRMELWNMTVSELGTYMDSNYIGGYPLSQLIHTTLSSSTKYVIIEEIISLTWTCRGCNENYFKTELQSLSTIDLGDYLIDNNLTYMYLGIPGCSADAFGLWYWLYPGSDTTLEDALEAYTVCAEEGIEAMRRRIANNAFEMECKGVEQYEVAYSAYLGNSMFPIVSLCEYSQKVNIIGQSASLCGASSTTGCSEDADCSDEGGSCDDYDYTKMASLPQGTNLLYYVKNGPSDDTNIEQKIFCDVPRFCVDHSGTRAFSGGHLRSAEMPEVKTLIEKATTGSYGITPGNALTLKYVAPFT